MGELLGSLFLLQIWEWTLRNEIDGFNVIGSGMLESRNQ